MANKEIDTAKPNTLRPIVLTADVSRSISATSNKTLHTGTEAWEVLAMKREGRLRRALMRHTSVAPNTLNLQRKATVAAMASAGAIAGVPIGLMVVTAITRSTVTATAIAIAIIVVAKMAMNQGTTRVAK
jgi:hypothetical protein